MGNVTLNFDVDEFIEEAEEALQAAIVAGVDYTAREIHRLIPSERKETRKAVTPIVGDQEGSVQLRFPSNRRYRARGTKTEQIMQRAWKSIRQTTLQRMEATFYQRIEE